MKNFPHQFNDLNKIHNALLAVKQLIDEEIALKDENFGELLTRNEIYTYRDKNLTIDEFLSQEEKKSKANRGYLTVARDIRRLFELLGFLTVFEDKSGSLSTQAIQLIASPSEDTRRELWKTSFLQLGLEGTDGEISHPYRILLKLIQDKPGIATKKLMLALEAENDSIEEYERIIELSQLPLTEIFESTGASLSMGRNAVKILPAIAEQLGDIERKGNRAFPVGRIIITEDEISTEIPSDARNSEGLSYSQYRPVTSDTIAVDPIFNSISRVSIDYTETIRVRQQRLAEHQEIVRQLGLFCEERAFNLYEGKFDCLATMGETALVFEIKTILDSRSDQEKQTIKGVGQLKYYKFSIVKQQMEYKDITEFLVYSRKPDDNLIQFCTAESIKVVWLEEGQFIVHNSEPNENIFFEPLGYVR